MRISYDIEFLIARPIPHTRGQPLVGCHYKTDSCEHGNEP